MNTREVQAALARLGYALVVDGAAGPKTRSALETFQRGRGLAADGIVGPQTIKALQAAIAEKAEPRTQAPPAPPSLPGFAQPRATRRIDEIIIHCTATPEGRDVSVETIRGWHIGQGWKDIGYHWVVMLDGSVKPGRPEAQVGSHVAGRNSGTLGVVYVGGVAADGKTPKDTRTPAQKAALLAHVRALIARYPTVRKVTGHNQYAAKACPSFDVRRDDLGRLV
ncbi:peptidoglycan-binding protein [Bosea sp. (in: a-proteobacteria)]|uniref:peptidoglycan recognition protein family protein n=1 Tax=Bosea sp. (in: a-proteobacteria) TaxID=1871050 RepID=UPI0027341A80|nr:peptidoglycan-binding protein [Bosea sp. (in: a-proteobacteria)]MDP3411144.1 peptidoglycan-binding protein [Bosea sp. (in: a-proteobacteria)]